jgi:hypothetical protein
MALRVSDFDSPFPGWINVRLNIEACLEKTQSVYLFVTTSGLRFSSTAFDLDLKILRFGTRLAAF